MRTICTGLVAAMLLAAWNAPTLAVPPDPDLWITNGPVFAVAEFDGTIYVGGVFSEVSRATGAGVVFDPNTGLPIANFPHVVGEVFAVTADGQGGWYIGGRFTSVGGLPRNNVAQVASNLSVTAWDPNPDGRINALVVSSRGTVFAGGQFNTIGGAVRQNIAELSASGSATSWDSPDPSSFVNALALHGGKLYLGGNFQFVGPSPRPRLAAVNELTGVIDSWAPNCNGPVRAIHPVVRSVPSPGTVTLLVGGTFGTVNFFVRTNLAEIRLDGTLTAWNPNPNGTVHAIQERNVVYVGGEFTSIAGVPRNGAAAIDPITAQATAWNPNPDGPVETLVWSSSTVLLGGSFLAVGGIPRSRFARVEDANGVVIDWNETGTNGPVHALAISGGAVYAGGQFSGLAGIPRSNLAAFDALTGEPNVWNPHPNGPVFSIALLTSTANVFRVFVGGGFTQIGGGPIEYLASVDPYTGAASGLDLTLNAPVHCMMLRDTTLYLSGTFGRVVSPIGTVDAGSRRLVTSIGAVSGQWTGWYTEVGTGMVSAMAAGPTDLFLGGGFTEVAGNPRLFLAAVPMTGASPALPTSFHPAPDAYVYSLLLSGSKLFVGGNFGTIAGQPRTRLASFDASGALTGWNPTANAPVRTLNEAESGLWVGGDFNLIGGQPRGRLANVDATTGLVFPEDPGFEDFEVYSVLVRGPALYVGGTFNGAAGLPQAHLAALVPPPNCSAVLGPFPAGAAPRALAAGDFDNDGIRDLAVCNTLFPYSVTVLRGGGSGGLGDGTFATAATLPLLHERPLDVAWADFDTDGLDDLVVTTSGLDARVGVYRSEGGGTFSPFAPMWLEGPPDGVDVMDMEQDGILDIVVCVTDSARSRGDGFVFVLRGLGSGGVGNGSFGNPKKLHRVDVYQQPRRALLHDFNQDGIPDLVHHGSATTLPNSIRMQPGLTPGCYQAGGSPPGSTAPGLAMGDFNEDGLQDLVHGSGRGFSVGYKSAVSNAADCSGGPWFNHWVSAFGASSTPRDVAVLDWNQDGIQDIVCSFDSTSTVAYVPGNGMDGVGDGSFQSWNDIAYVDSWGLAVGDFTGDGAPDLAVSQYHCNAVTIIPSGYTPTLPMQLTLLSPNGGEIWSPAPLPDLGNEGPPRISPPALAASSASVPLRVAATQQIAWTKGAGVGGVDVAVSRNNGATWQTIATNVPGTSMNWIVTPPATSQARIRVRDAAVPQRADASDGAFEVQTPTTDADPSLPRTAAFLVTGRQPASGTVHFRLESPSTGMASVQIYDVAGRHVRVLAQGPTEAGRHDLVWDGRDGAGRAAAGGVYFVRARMGAHEVTRKVVLLP